MVRIEILTGPQAGRVVELPPGRHTAGRRADAALPLSEESVSSRHVELEVAGDGSVRFRDLGSTNGTWSAGMKVEEGAWFPGSELRLGACRLRLIPDEEDTPAPAEGRGESPEEQAVHRRAVAEALSQRRRGGPWILLLLAVLVMGVAATWWHFQGGGEVAGESVAGPMAGGREQAPEDLLEGQGRFSPEVGASWQLAEGLELAGGALQAASGPPRTATLVSRLPLPEDAGGLRLAGAARGRVEVEVEFGPGEDDRPLGTWFAGILGDGPLGLPLPEACGWFRLRLRLEGGARLSDLTAAAGPAAAGHSHETRQVVLAGANLLLRHRDGRPLLVVRGSGGAWSTTPGGLRFEATPGAGSLVLAPAPATLESGGLLILAEGGPVTAAAGVQVEDSPGLLLGGEALRLLVRTGEPASFTGLSGAEVAWSGRRLELRWDLRDAYARAARLVRRVEDAARDEDDRALLEATATLLRELPLDEEQVGRALALRREAILRGRTELEGIRTALAEALFLRSARDLESVRRRAASLGARLPGTEVAREAVGLAEDVAASLAIARREEAEEELAYRQRLAVVLGREYPLLGTWLQAHAPASGAGGEEQE